MLPLGIVLIIVAILVFRFVSNGMSQSLMTRARVFNNTGIVIFLQLLWLSLLILGLYVIWQVQPTIVLVLVGIYAILWVFGYFMGSKKSKVTKIFKIYRQLKLYRPEQDSLSHYKQAATTYFQSLNWEERRIQMTVETMLEDKTEDDTDIKDITKSILNFENLDTSLGQNFDFKRYLKQSAKEQQVIDTAYTKIFGSAEDVTERPELSKHALTWIESVGLNPDDMSNGQLQVFSEIDDHGKSNMVIKACYGIATASMFLAAFSLITLDLWGVGLYLFLSFTLWFIGNKLQMRRISKKFHEASITKYASEQSQNK